jgi:hypothetical protein
VVLINGTTVTVKVARVRPCHSRMLFDRAYQRETQEMVFDAHDHAGRTTDSHRQIFVAWVESDVYAEITI